MSRKIRGSIRGSIRGLIRGLKLHLLEEINSRKN